MKGLELWLTEEIMCDCVILQCHPDKSDRVNGSCADPESPYKCAAQKKGLELYRTWKSVWKCVRLRCHLTEGIRAVSNQDVEWRCEWHAWDYPCTKSRAVWSMKLEDKQHWPLPECQLLRIVSIFKLLHILLLVYKCIHNLAPKIS